MVMAISNRKIRDEEFDVCMISPMFVNTMGGPTGSSIIE